MNKTDEINYLKPFLNNKCGSGVREPHAFNASDATTKIIDFIKNDYGGTNAKSINGVELKTVIDRLFETAAPLPPPIINVYKKMLADIIKALRLPKDKWDSAVIKFCRLLDCGCIKSNPNKHAICSLFDAGYPNILVMSSTVTPHPSIKMWKGKPYQW